MKPIKSILSRSLIAIGLFSFNISTSGADPADWLPPGSDINAIMSVPEYTRSDVSEDNQWLLGKLLFMSPTLMGEKATRLGLSCNSCHLSGHANTSFYIDGLSDVPGRIDLTSAFWTDRREDQVFNPVEIPTLRNIRETAPYGLTMKTNSLEEFTRHVIEIEFEGPKLNATEMNALLHYLNELGENSTREISTAISLDRYVELTNIALQRGNSELVLSLVKEELGRRDKKSPGNYVKLAKNLQKIVRDTTLSTNEKAKQLAALARNYQNLK